ncbi:hypothetical protein [Salinarimonas ramus]|uniref:Uncharacterized protein n=1 Tax=Salinarimonas ramus TaxID=690164 RepID=A0A917Q9M7_9HYPH|nr:hypothetical protein [Salinarimonas ramus]GGK36765.1 hypothetical protein GCM10011322_24710 [Salinarimonas ramus]
MATNETLSAPTRKKPREITLSAEEVRGLYYLKERHITDILDAAVLLEESERKLALQMIRTMIDHRRSLLS